MQYALPTFEGNPGRAMAVPSIHIIVANGNVKLEGVVATEGDTSKTDAEALAARPLSV
jgi:hypothetical protein